MKTTRGEPLAAAGMALLLALGANVPAANAAGSALVGVYYSTWFTSIMWSDVWGTPMLGNYDSSASPLAKPRLCH